MTPADVKEARQYVAALREVTQLAIDIADATQPLNGPPSDLDPRANAHAAACNILRYVAESIHNELEDAE